MSRSPTSIDEGSPAVPPSAPDVLRARVIGENLLEVEFADGRTGRFDVGPYLNYPAFAALKSPVYFRSVYVALGTVCWSEGEDFSPDTLVAHSVF